MSFLLFVLAAQSVAVCFGHFQVEVKKKDSSSIATMLSYVEPSAFFDMP